MFGAILGDMIGSPYEFNSHNYKAKDFPLFSEASHFTDDTVMTLAVADALMNAGEGENLQQRLIRSMQTIGRRHPYSGYGSMFNCWLYQESARPYNSYGNGAAMRVSSVAWICEDIQTVREMARLTASVSHNHPEGYKGAEAVASAIFLARTGSSKKEIRSYISREFQYDLSRTCDAIRPKYRMDETCQGSVPEAITAFLEGDSFEDVIRTAVSLGGDSDTIADMAGAMAEGFYGVPEGLKTECMVRLTPDLREILRQFCERYHGA